MAMLVLLPCYLGPVLVPPQQLRPMYNKDVQPSIAHGTPVRHDTAMAARRYPGSATTPLPLPSRTHAQYEIGRISAIPGIQI